MNQLVACCPQDRTPIVSTALRPIPIALLHRPVETVLEAADGQ